MTPNPLRGAHLLGLLRRVQASLGEEASIALILGAEALIIRIESGDQRPGRVFSVMSRSVPWLQIECGPADPFELELEWMIDMMKP